jgi:hypothetical protein
MYRLRWKTSMILFRTPRLLGLSSSTDFKNTYEVLFLSVLYICQIFKEFHVLFSRLLSISKKEKMFLLLLTLLQEKLS